MSAWDGVWWAVTTMTTVGYGDLSPQTNVGRVIGIVVMLFGIGFLAMLTGAVAQRFLSERVESVAAETQEEVAEDVETAETELLRELREIRTRLERLELRLGRH